MMSLSTCDSEICCCRQLLQECSMQANVISFHIQKRLRYIYSAKPLVIIQLKIVLSRNQIISLLEKRQEFDYIIHIEIYINQFFVQLNYTQVRSYCNTQQQHETFRNLQRLEIFIVLLKRLVSDFRFYLTKLYNCIELNSQQVFCFFLILCRIIFICFQR